ncbi:hypothetical protein [Cardinium endosymbiont of Nabis limbatus]|uniref:hypothetical protein n=1 Tax=Cardinium endosymbiont of Nabis limbatus TaxID=3066217 RepID=UPI003AF37E76
MNQWANTESTKTTRLLEALALSSMVHKILNKSVDFLTSDDPTDPDIKFIKKLFLEKYLCLDACAQACTKDDSVKKLFDQEKDLIATLHACAEPLLALHESDKQNDIISEFDLLDKLLEQIH